MNVNRKNIVLVGMPGCGKSLIGKILADEINFEFVDMDMYIEQKYDCTISEIFKQSEQRFREMETDAVKELCKLTNTVIATGGGVVKNQFNIECLKMNSIIYFIDRSIENIYNDIDISKRPLLNTNKDNLYKLYEERYEIYKQSSNIIIENNDEIDSVIRAIKKSLDELET